jgi:hypothetical protein
MENELGEERPSHRKLIIGAVAAVAVGGAFLFFWQSVLQFMFMEPAWDLPYCNKLLSQHAPQLSQVEFVPKYGENRTFKATGTIYSEQQDGDIVKFLAEGVEDKVFRCEVEITSTAGKAGAVKDRYNCTTAFVSYDSEVKDNWALTRVLIENVIPISPLMYTTLITYYNPSFSSTFEPRLQALREHQCTI